MGVGHRRLSSSQRRETLISPVRDPQRLHGSASLPHRFVCPFAVLTPSLYCPSPMVAREFARASSRDRVACCQEA
ncbi:hypothetical protein BD309DRAFT_990569 [Dichomitus squalens]|uniref:Uncharacterized protein n=2 Tax=Dichomitus squalens TaxID=114155 RepID=A0A4Q9PK38_9APHY|nr:uncharacterized protein DICSQDRAFT_157091 [Dichomitus squalens LYAD-421 SS1]EJF57856.1 hypothetical protein DICSQDRAFT_157091 [Dichomitus squalens LYAD-421 SS1]TBU21991.1 hypothetical protein BD311DRAFT_677093 [Dichomitus squalens]TBU44041.1 hypothetical protein BD309DRAFT_990569 [Dichomitus squalens]TBU54472.1 hypothetical protein BD310DRAFT_827928 [Dichomitus squalens]